MGLVGRKLMCRVFIGEVGAGVTLWSPGAYGRTWRHPHPLRGTITRNRHEPRYSRARVLRQIRHRLPRLPPPRRPGRPLHPHPPGLLLARHGPGHPRNGTDDLGPTRHPGGRDNHPRRRRREVRGFLTGQRMARNSSRRDRAAFILHRLAIRAPRAQGRLRR
ncbi:hypothetical protein E6W17_32105 [Streptomyces sp. A1547]|nr:hypothetical protein E6W17_32105 [Streptomyces sp. A1547]